MELCFPFLMMPFEGCGLHTFFDVTGMDDRDGTEAWAVVDRREIQLLYFD